MTDQFGQRPNFLLSLCATVGAFVLAYYAAMIAARAVTALAPRPVDSLILVLDEATGEHRFVKMSELSQWELVARTAPEAAREFSHSDNGKVKECEETPITVAPNWRPEDAAQASE